ncbi:MAG: acetyl-CoA carboxylase biotin carboxyl carrier protein [bacterium]|nr:acetyl-CoA carboxylase biotin carboxyl carrier protein [bacterium]
MELKEIKELIKLVSESGVSEVEVERGDFKIAIKKTEEKTMVVQQTQPMMVHTQSSHVATHTAPTAETPAQKAEVVSNLITIKSPMIGTYYKSASPEKPAFVQIGDEIEPGHVLCVVEAMKLFNEIESEVSGKIVKILVDNARPVEYDQPLFLVEPK